jgi:myo-inositol 2-dehydrogenase/D-chiro-inositol 1-dehydrogenase
MNFFLERYEAAYRVKCRLSVAHLGDKSIAIPGIEDGLRAEVMADGAAKSLETGLSALTSNLPIWVVAV